VCDERRSGLCIDRRSGLCREAGELIVTAWSQTSVVESKVNAVDLVTETDKKVEQLIRTRLLEAYPEDQFIGRDSGASLIRAVIYAAVVASGEEDVAETGMPEESLLTVRCPYPSV
jgi:fructose-1,6-bisphosphatase/inositol monophosphatase family enzyme